MNARNEAKRLRRAMRVHGRLNVENMTHLLGMDFDGRRFKGVKLDEISCGGNIGLSDRLSEPERRWAMSHALGHAVLHAKGNQVWLRTCTQLPDKLERQAEEFAYVLLVDKDEARNIGLKTVEELASHFEVPPERVEMQGKLL